MDALKAGGKPLQPLKRKRLSEEISEQLKAAIFKGTYTPGDRLPPEGHLGRIFQVGRPVVREALRSLENSGLISVKPGAGGGAFVKRIGSHTLIETLEGIVKLDHVSMEELTEARMAVEMAVLPLVMERIRPEDLDALEHNIREAQECLEKGIEEPKNLMFHVLLANASRNQLLIKIVKALFGVLAGFIATQEYSYERKKTVLEEHRELFQLLRAKRHREVEAALSRHIVGTMMQFEKGDRDLPDQPRHRSISIT